MPDLTYVELFAGAGGMSLGLEAAGWTAVAHAEIEPHARAVLRKYWPDTPLEGDVSQMDGTKYRGVTLLTGGSPCQDLSIAGKRAGMTEGSGTRSSLFFEQVRIWQETQAPYILWENVCGALSSNNGRDFAAVLSALVGAAVPVPSDGWESAGVAAGPTGVAAWRILDAQWFSVPQRRRRVFVLGVRPGGVDPAEVLLDGDGVCGDSAAGGEAGEGTAPDAGRGVAGGCWPIDVRNATRTTDKSEQNRQGVGIGEDGDPSPTLTGMFVPAVVNALAYDDRNQASAEVHHTLRAEGIGGRVSDAVLTYDARGNGDGAVVNTLAGDHANRVTDYTPIVMRQREGNGDALAFHATQDPISGDISPALGANAQIGVIGVDAYAIRTANTNANGHGIAENVTHTLDGANGQAVMVMRQREGKPGGGKGPLLSEGQRLTLGTTNDQVVFPTLTMGAHTAAPGLNGQDAVPIHDAMLRAGVGRPRRLMPVECERLMGWPEEEKSAILVVCSDHLESDALVAQKSLKSPSAAGNAESAKSLSLALLAEWSSQHGEVVIDAPALWRVEINCETPRVTIVNVMNGWRCDAKSAEQLAEFDHLVRDARIALWPVGGLGIAAREAQVGRVASHQNTTSSTDRQSGRKPVAGFGQESAVSVSGAANGPSAERSTTSEVTPSFQSCALSFQTLCYSVARVISGLIRGETQIGSSFAFEVTIRRGHTAIGIDEQGREYALKDTPRYKLCGNGVASPVAQWIAWRLAQVIGRS